MKGGFNILCEGLGTFRSDLGARTERTETLAHFDETGVREPPIDDAPTHTLTKLSCSPSPVHLVQTASGSTATVLWILRERYGSLYPIIFHLLGGIFNQRFCITKPDVRFVGRSTWMQFVEQSTESSALGLRPAQNRGSTSYLGVLIYDFGCTVLGN